MIDWPNGRDWPGLDVSFHQLRTLPRTIFKRRGLVKPPYACKSSTMKLVKRIFNCFAGLPETSVQHSCFCTRPPFRGEDYNIVEIGEDGSGAEISLSTCKCCGTIWLTYSIEWPHYSRSGRWWRVEVAAENNRSVSAATAKAFVESAAEGFVGGSFFNSRGHAITAPINVA